MQEAAVGGGHLKTQVAERWPPAAEAGRWMAASLTLAARGGDTSGMPIARILCQARWWWRISAKEWALGA